MASGWPLDSWYDAPPGTILKTSADGIEVATAQGTLLLTRCQMEGEEEMDANEFALHYGIGQGAVLG